MAEKRMISKVISVSEKVNELPDIFDMLLFTWMIPHADDFGRLSGSPAKVKALIVPMLDKTNSEIEGSLGRLNDKGLILWYEVNGDKIIQIENFDKHQHGLHKRTKSKFPEVPGNSEKFPLNRTELNRTEEKGTEQICGSGDSINPYRIFENEGFGTISPVLKDQIDDLVETYGEHWFAEAIKIAVVSGKRSLAYVNGILKRWKTGGINEPWTEEKNDRLSFIDDM